MTASVWLISRLHQDNWGILALASLRRDVAVDVNSLDDVVNDGYVG
jgi:hypothetical protein